jgi:hypothetical protein
MGRESPSLKKGLDLDWRDGAILLFTIEQEKVRDVEYTQQFVKTRTISRKTLYRHRNRLLEHGVLQKDYDKAVDAIVYSVPKRFRDLAKKAAFRRAVAERRSFSISLQKRKKKSIVLPSMRPLVELVPEGYDPQTVLELAAWIKRDPAGWPKDDYVREAKRFLEDYPELVPKIGRPSGDPDRYAFIWSKDVRKELHLPTPRSSRFFNMKLVYDAMTTNVSEDGSAIGPVFVGAYWLPVVVDYIPIYSTRMQPLQYVGRPVAYQPITEPQSVCVAVRRAADSNMRVVHVETRKGTLEKAWVRAVAKQLKAKKTARKGHDSLKEDDRRALLLNLRNVLARHRLLIPPRYAPLIDDLREYSYRIPSRGYVIALATAVDLCLK